MREQFRIRVGVRVRLRGILGTEGTNPDAVIGVPKPFAYLH